MIMHLKIILMTTSESRLTHASVAVMAVQTAATILAWIRQALVLLLLTMLTRPAGFTPTKVPSHKIKYT